MTLVLLTNVRHYTGPGALEALAAAGCRMACHDAAFVDSAARAEHDERYALGSALAGQTPESIHAEVLERSGLPDATVSNDVYPITQNSIETIPLDDLRATFEAVVVFPIRLTQLLLPAMKARRRGAFVFVTSARETRPELGFAVPTALRADTTAFAKALAKEAALFGIQANVVAPNYLYSEMYYSARAIHR